MLNTACLLLLCFGGPAATVDFERDVARVLVANCLECHHPAKPSGGLSLGTESALLAGGDSGPAIAPGRPNESFLIHRVSDGEMPPPDEGREPLTAAVIEQLRAWIAAGAKWPPDRELGLHELPVDLDAARRHWAFQPIVRPPIPKSSRAEQGANPIDAFIWRGLEEGGLQPPQPAEPADLLRRMTLDVIGLPPTLAKQRVFLADNAPDAPARLVDRLLNHPGYGERWARYWLDLVRYADSNGYERDGAKPSVWPAHRETPPPPAP